MSDPGNNLQSALNIGNLSGTRIFNDLVNNLDRNDFYRFSLTNTSDFSLILSGLSDDADVRLVVDLNKNNQFDVGEDLYESSNSGSTKETISATLGTGTYFVWVNTFDASVQTNYTLSLSAKNTLLTTSSDPGNTLSTAFNLGNLSSPRNFIDFVGTFDSNDFYRFNLTQTSNLQLVLSDLSADADVRVIQDKNSNGKVDLGEILVEGSNSGTTNENIAKTLTTGTYFVSVDSNDENINTKYNLNLWATVTTPSNFDDYIIGTDNIENIDALAGNDRIDGRGNNDHLIGGSDNDSLYGENGNDTLDGGTSNDRLSGGAGNDSAIGGTGNDTYIVDSTGDIISETSTSATEIDTVEAYASYTLGNNLENLTLKGINKLNGKGNSLKNRLVGNLNINILEGRDGNDTLYGAANDDSLYGENGNDYLNGGSGRDRLSGGTGNDTLEGGTGNDTYVVDSTGDVINESSNVAQETDLVEAYVSYTLGNNLERLTLKSFDRLNGIGNSLNNTLTGNGNANILEGRDGNDTLYGGAGNDSLYGENGNDTLDGGTGNDRLSGGIGIDRAIGGTGNDTYIIDNTADIINETSTLATEIDSVDAYATYTLSSNLEKLTLKGSSQINGKGNNLNNHLTGNSNNNLLDGSSGYDVLIGGSGNDTLLGGSGNDTLIGGIGSDSLTGNSGNDRFVFFFRSEGVDKINDFNPVDDTIVVSAKGFGGGLKAQATLLSSQFVKGTAAADSSDRFIYNSSNGAMYFDIDGNGSVAQVQIASLSTGLAMTNADILMI